MRELTAPRPATVAVQLCAAWAVGAVAPPMAWSALPIAAFGGWTVLSGIAIVSALAVLAFLIGAITVTREVSALGATGGGRVLWALLVMGGGTIGWAMGWAVTDVARIGVSGNALLTFLLGGVPFALVAGFLLRGWQFSTAALALSMVLIGAGVVALRHEPPDEMERRLVANDVHRETAYAVAIPGYLPAGDPDYGNRLGGGSFRPANPAAVPPDRYIRIAAYERASVDEPMCGQPTAQDSRLWWGTCAVEADGLVYRHNEIAHGYQVPVDHLYVTVVGTPAVHHDLLRAAATSLHLATADDLGHQEQTGEYYAAAIPGYQGQVTGAPPGMMYEPADHTGSGVRSVSIWLHITYAAGDSICFRTTECTPDGPGLTYVRTEDAHGYVVRRDEVNVRVQGGLRVDRTLLRQAAVDARPATDEELRRSLPALQPSSLIGRLRQWLRDF